MNTVVPVPSTVQYSSVRLFHSIPACWIVHNTSNADPYRNTMNTVQFEYTMNGTQVRYVYSNTIHWLESTRFNTTYKYFVLKKEYCT